MAVEARSWKGKYFIIEKLRLNGNVSLFTPRRHIKVRARRVGRIEGDKRIYYGQVPLFGRVCARLTSHESENDYSDGMVSRVINISVFNLRY